MPTVIDKKTGKKKKLPYPGQKGYDPNMPGMPASMPPKKDDKKKKGMPFPFPPKKKKKAPGVAKKGNGVY